MAPTLKHTFSMRGYMSREYSHDVSPVLGGPSRSIVPLISGFVQGNGLSAEVQPGGADWILIDHAINVAHLDVRLQARTDDGYSLYIHYNGILKFDEKANKVLLWDPEAKTTEYGDHEWFAAPIIETNDPKFKWVENSLWVGQGRFVVDKMGSAVEYQIYQVCN